MALKAFPFDSVDTTETEYSLLFQQLQDDGLAGAPGSTAGQVTAGSGMQVNVAAFPLAILAGFVLYSDAVEPLTLAGGSSQPRIDRVVLRVDPTSNLFVIAVLAGAPAVSPSAPALTQVLGEVWEISLAQIAVAAGAVNIVSANITDERVFVSSRVGAWTTATRVQAAGRVGFNFSTGKLEYFDGGAWVTVGVTDWGSITNKPTTFAPIIGTASNQAKAGDWVPAWSDVTNKPATYPPTIGGASTQAVAGNDSRLTDARTPTAHDINGSAHTGQLDPSRVNLNSFSLSGPTLQAWAAQVDQHHLPFVGEATVISGSQIAHGMSNAPIAVFTQISEDSPVIQNLIRARVSIVDASPGTFKVWFYRTDSNIEFVDNLVKFFWMAI